MLSPLTAANGWDCSQRALDSSRRASSRPVIYFCNSDSGRCYRDSLRMRFLPAAGQGLVTTGFTLTQIDGTTISALSLVAPLQLEEFVHAIQLRWMPSDSPAYSVGLMTGSVAGRLSIVTNSSSTSVKNLSTTTPDGAQEDQPPNNRSKDTKKSQGVGLAVGGVVTILLTVVL